MNRHPVQLEDRVFTHYVTVHLRYLMTHYLIP